MWGIICSPLLLFLVVIFSFPCSTTTQEEIFGIVRIPMVVKGLNNQRMRIIQDITLATLLGAPVKLPPRVHTRLNCHYDLKCAKVFVKGPSLWEVYNEKVTLENLRELGVWIVKHQNEVDNETNTHYIKGRWPVAASQLESLKEHYFACRYLDVGVDCVFDSNCCTALIPDTEKALELLKKVNFAFQSAKKFQSESAKIVSALREQTQQNRTVAMHWRLDKDFTDSEHILSAREYCRVMFNTSLALTKNRFFRHTPSSEKIHVLVLGDTNVTNLEIFLDSCHGINRSAFEFHSKETLLSKNESLILSSEYTDVKGQLDFELGAMSDIFLGSPFSSFSVLIAFYRFGMADNVKNRLRTVMSNIDVQDRLGRLFSMQFPYSNPLAKIKTKCTIVGETVRIFHGALKDCIDEEIRRGFVKRAKFGYRKKPLKPEITSQHHRKTKK